MRNLLLKRQVQHQNWQTQLGSLRKWPGSSIQLIKIYSRRSSVLIAVDRQAQRNQLVSSIQLIRSYCTPPAANLRDRKLLQCTYYPHIVPMLTYSYLHSLSTSADCICQHPDAMTSNHHHYGWRIFPCIQPENSEFYCIRTHIFTMYLFACVCMLVFYWDPCVNTKRGHGKDI